MINYDALLHENRNALAALAAHIPPGKSLDIVISASFPSKEVALAARTFVKEKTLERDGGAYQAGFTINMVPDERGFHGCDIALYTCPTPEIITDAEMVMREACAQFGGEQPGWDIVLPGTGRVREH